MCLNNQKIAALVAGLFVLAITGCASIPTTIQPSQQIPLGGSYHRIVKGETLWFISKNYNVELDELIKLNHILDVSNIEIGQLIIIPSARQLELPKYSPEDFVWPLRGKIITSYGQTFNNMLNKGINIQPYQDTEVVASRSGRVVFYHNDFISYGKTIIIAHADGFSTVYSGRGIEIFVKTGDNVERGFRIAKVSSGANKQGFYLHFEIRKGYVPQNPNFYLP